MSNRALTWAFDQELKSGPKFVLVALADWADDEGSCFPGIPTIARKTGSSQTGVRDNLARLKDAGLIREERRSRPGGRGRTSNRYWLQMSGRVDVSPETVQEPESGGIIADDQEPDSGRSRAGFRADQEPDSGGEIEPSVNTPQGEPLDTPPTPSAFDLGWQSWPRKVGKKSAQSSWPRAVKAHGSEDDLILDVERFGAAYSRYPAHKQSFIPHLASWLNGERWTDPLPDPGPGRGPAAAVEAGKGLVARLTAEQGRMIES